MSNLILKVSKDRAATTSLHQCFTTLVNQHLPLHSPPQGAVWSPLSVQTRQAQSPQAVLVGHYCQPLKESKAVHPAVEMFL